MKLNGIIVALCSVGILNAHAENVATRQIFSRGRRDSRIRSARIRPNENPLFNS